MVDQAALAEMELFGVPTFFRYSQDEGFRARVLLRAEAIARVFTDKNISSDEIISRYLADPTQFTLKVKDLTEVGFEFGKTGFQKWLSNTDRMKPPATLEKYIESLRKQWDKFDETT